MPPSSFTDLLHLAQGGDAAASGSVFAMAYEELRRLAHRVGSDAVGRTLQPTALVHEAWLKMANGLEAVNDRTHFFAIASTAMRQVLVDHAKAMRRVKRGGDRKAIAIDADLSDRIAGSAPNPLDVCALDECLEQLAELNPRHARVVELRVFGGLTIAEAARVLGVSHGTIETDWSMARAWLGSRIASAS